ncbi:hypothetical protein BH09PLA1_BH09PLA1_01440 [soil metagenome]
MKAYALLQLKTGEQIQSDVVDATRRMAIHAHRLGHALTLVRASLNRGEWMTWRKMHGLSKGKVDRAIDLYKAAKNEHELAGMTISQAYRRFGVVKKKLDAPELHAGHPVKAPSGKSSRSAPDMALVQCLDSLGELLASLDDALADLEVDPDRANSERLEAAERRLAVLADRLSNVRRKIAA